MRSRLSVVLLLVAGLAFSLLFARQMIKSRDLDRASWIEPRVRVLTYGTLVATQGPGVEIFRRFERERHVKIEVVSSDAGLMLEKLKIGGAFDLVLGLDHVLAEQARERFRWRTVDVPREGWFPAPAAVSDQSFVAIDWSPLTFVYRKDEQPVPRRAADLLDVQFKGQFTVEDPRATTPGLEFARWVKRLHGAGAREWLERFKPNVNAVAPTWTAAYGMFEHHQTRFVWTFLTSLAFHWGIEKHREYEPLIFPEGHPAQVELAAVPEDCRACELGEALLRELLTDESQRQIMTKNFMFPVKSALIADTVYAELPELKLVPTPATTDLKEWDGVFAR